MLATAIAGIVIAITFAAPPGPVAMETVRRGMRGGFASALRVQLGSIVGDMAWCTVALLGLAPMAQLPVIRGVLALAGVSLLIYFGVMGTAESLKKPAAVALEASAQANGAFRSGVAISMANPMAVGYWLSVGGALIATGVAGQSPAQTGLFVAGFLAGTFAWAFIMAGAVRWSKSLMTPHVFRVINFVCGLALLFFGATLAKDMIAALL